MNRFPIIILLLAIAFEITIAVLFGMEKINFKVFLLNSIVATIVATTQGIMVYRKKNGEA